MSGWQSIGWNAGSVKVVGFTTAGRKGSTTVKVELTVTNAWDLGDLIRSLAELRDGPSSPNREVAASE